MSIYDTHKPAGGGMYLKIADKETVRVRIASEPAIYESEGKNDKGEVQLSTRYAWLVWNQDEQAPQVLQMSATFFRSLATLYKDPDWGDPTGYDIKITREGTGLNTTYSVVASPNREPLGPEAKKALDGIDLLDKLQSNYTSHIMWLADADGSNARKNASPAVSKTDPRQADSTETGDDFRDEPINMDDIPF